MKNVIIAYQSKEDDCLLRCQEYSIKSELNVLGYVPINEALKYCILNKVDTIIIESLTDLMFLNSFEKSIREFESNDIKIRCLKEGIELFDGSSSSAIFLHAIFYVLDSHRKFISQRIKCGIEARKRKLSEN